MLEGFRVEQVVAPAPVQQRQGAGFGVVRAKGIQAQQGVNAALFALAHRLAQGLNGGVFNAWLAADPLSTCSAVDQQFGDQLPAAVQAGLGLSLVAGDQALQLWARLLQQQGQALVQAAFAIQRRRDGVEGDQRMQAEARQGAAPGVFLWLAGTAEIEHRQQRFAAAGQHGQFVAVFGQHRLAGVDQVEPGIAGQ